MCYPSPTFLASYSSSALYPSPTHLPLPAPASYPSSSLYPSPTRLPFSPSVPISYLQSSSHTRLLPTLLSLCTSLLFTLLLSMSVSSSPLSMPVLYPLSSLYACLLHTSSMPVFYPLSSLYACLLSTLLSLCLSSTHSPPSMPVSYTPLLCLSVPR